MDTRARMEALAKEKEDARVQKEKEEEERLRTYRGMIGGMNKIMKDFAYDFEVREADAAKQAAKEASASQRFGAGGQLLRAMTMQGPSETRGKPLMKRITTAGFHAIGRLLAWFAKSPEPETYTGQDPEKLIKSLVKQQSQNTAAYKIFKAMYIVLTVWFVFSSILMVYSGQQYFNSVVPGIRDIYQTGSAKRIAILFDFYCEKQLHGALETLNHMIHIGFWSYPVDFFGLQHSMQSILTSREEISMVQMGFQALSEEKRYVPLTSGGLLFRRVGTEGHVLLQSDLYPSCITIGVFGCARNLTITASSWYKRLLEVDTSSLVSATQYDFAEYDILADLLEADAQAAKEKQEAQQKQDATGGGGMSVASMATAITLAVCITNDGRLGVLTPEKVAKDNSTEEDDVIYDAVGHATQQFLNDVTDLSLNFSMMHPVTFDSNTTIWEKRFYKEIQGLSQDHLKCTTTSTTSTTTSTTTVSTTTQVPSTTTTEATLLVLATTSAEPPSTTSAMMTGNASMMMGPSGSSMMGFGVSTYGDGWICVPVEDATTSTTTTTTDRPYPFVKDYYERKLYTEWENQRPELASVGETILPPSTDSFAFDPTISILFKIPFPNVETELEASANSNLDDLLYQKARDATRARMEAGELSLLEAEEFRKSEGQAPPPISNPKHPNKIVSFLVGKITLSLEKFGTILTDKIFMDPETYSSYIVESGGRIVMSNDHSQYVQDGILGFKCIWDLPKFSIIESGWLSPMAPDIQYYDDIILYRIKGKRLGSNFWVVIYADSSPLLMDFVYVCAILLIVLGIVPYFTTMMLGLLYAYKQKAISSSAHKKDEALREALDTLKAVDKTTRG